MFPFAKVFLQLIRSAYKFDTYTFSLLLTAPGFDRVSEARKILPARFFLLPLFSLFFQLLPAFSLAGGSPK